MGRLWAWAGLLAVLALLPGSTRGLTHGQYVHDAGTSLEQDAAALPDCLHALNQAMHTAGELRVRLLRQQYQHAADPATATGHGGLSSSLVLVALGALAWWASTRVARIERQRLAAAVADGERHASELSTLAQDRDRRWVASTEEACYYMEQWQAERSMAAELRMRCQQQEQLLHELTAAAAAAMPPEPQPASSDAVRSPTKDQALALTLQLQDENGKLRDELEGLKQQLQQAMAAQPQRGSPIKRHLAAALVHAADPPHESQTALQAAEQEVAALRGREAELRGEVAELRHQLADSAQQARASDSSHGRLAAERDRAVAEAAGLQGQVVALQTQLAHSVPRNQHDAEMEVQRLRHKEELLSPYRMAAIIAGQGMSPAASQLLQQAASPLMSALAAGALPTPPDSVAPPTGQQGYVQGRTRGTAIVGHALDFEGAAAASGDFASSGPSLCNGLTPLHPTQHAHAGTPMGAAGASPGAAVSPEAYTANGAARGSATPQSATTPQATGTPGSEASVKTTAVGALQPRAVASPLSSSVAQRTVVGSSIQCSPAGSQASNGRLSNIKQRCARINARLAHFENRSPGGSPAMAETAQAAAAAHSPLSTAASPGQEA